MKKIGRNDPCHCGSKKKFKKCCESKMIGGRYMATKINALQTTRASGMTGLFNRQISAISRPTTETKSIRAVEQSPISNVPSPISESAEKVEAKENLC